MKRILSLILAVCMILTLAPVVIYADEPTYAEGTLIGDYTFNEEFSKTEIGKLMLKDYTSANDTFEVTYPAEGGMRITRTAKASTAGTDIARAGINFIKVLDAEKGKYQEGLTGVYAIDITMRAEIGIVDGKSGRTDLYISDIPSSTTKTDHNVRITPGFKVVKVNGSKEIIRWPNALDKNYRTYRWLVDTENDKFYGYELKDGKYTYIGEDSYNLDKISTLMYSPRDGFITEGSFVEFAGIRIYEIQDTTPPAEEPEEPPVEPDEPVIPEEPEEPALPEYPVPEGSTLIGDYTFTEEFSKTELGKLVLNDNTKSDDAYTVSYPEDGGMRITRNSKTSTSKDSVSRAAVNFIKVIDAEKGIYQQGLSGKYAIDITFKGELTKPEGTSGRTDIYICDTVNAPITSTMTHSIRVSPGMKIEKYYTSTKKLGFGHGLSGEYRTYRWIIDTTSDAFYGYNLVDNKLEYVGEDLYDQDSIASFVYAPRDAYLTEGSYFDIKGMKIYEIESETDSFATGFKNAAVVEGFKDVNGADIDMSAVTESISLPAQWADYTVVSSNPAVIKEDGTVKRAATDKEVTLTVKGTYLSVTLERDYTFTVKADENAVEPDEPEQPSDPLLGGKLLFDYDLNKAFAESEIGKKVIVDNYDSVNYDYDVTYGDNGIKIEYKGEPVFTNEAYTSGASVNAFGLNLAKLMEDNTENGYRLYKTGFSGLYAVEMTMTIDQGAGWAAGTNKSSGRADLYFGDKSETFTESGFINLRYSYKSPSLVAHVASTKNFNMSSFSYGKEFTFRIILDSKNRKYYGYSKNADGTYKFNGESACDINALTYFWYGTRTFNENGDAITFKNIKLYEIERDPDAVGELYYENVKSTLTNTFNTVSGGVADFRNLSENIVIPADVSRAYTVTSSNKSILGTDGTINEKLYEDTPVMLSVAGSYSGVYFVKDYDFVVKERKDIQRAEIAKYNYANGDAELIYSGDNKNTDEGFEIVNKEYADGTTIGLLKSKKYSDSKSSTYVYDYMGSYDFDVKVAPKLTSGNAFVEIGNYNVDTGAFESYGKVKISQSGAFYCDEYDDIRLCELADEYGLKFRINTDEKTIWVWANSGASHYDGYSYEGNKPVNAYRVGFEEAAEGDSVVLKSAEFNRLVVGNDDYISKVLNTVNSITANTIVNNPDDAFGAITLPAFKGFDIQWSADNALADLEGKKVYRSANDENITITAVVSSNENPEVKVRKDFYLKVKAATNPKDILDGALVKINASGVTNQKQLVADLKLPKVTEEGYAVTWESLSPGYISSEGVINKTINVEKPTKVTFKVTVSSEGESASKNVVFTLAKRGVDVTLNTSDITASADGVVTYKATVSGNASGALKDGKGNTLVGFDVENGKVAFDYKNSDFARYAVNNTTELAFVMNFIDQCVSILADGKVLVDYVPMLVAGDGFSKVDSIGSISNEKVVMDEYALFNYNMKVFDYIGTFGNVFVAGNRTMSTNSLGGVKVNWTTSNSSVMTNDGVFKAPSGITFYDVVLELSTNSTSGAKHIETLNCVAVPDDAENVAAKASVVSTLKEDVVNNKTKLTDNDFTTYLEAVDVKSKDYILLELKGVKEVNGVYLFQLDDGIKSCDVYLSLDGINWGEPVTSAVINDVNSNYITFDYQDAKYIKIANILCNNNKFKLYEIKAYLTYSSNNKAAFDIAALEMPKDYNLKETSLELAKIGSVYGSKLTWTSSKPEVVSADGKVTRAKVATEVILTVTAEFEGVTATKKFTYLVPAAKNESAGGSGGGGGGGSIAGVNTGGAGMAATPTVPEVELEKEVIEVVEKGIFTDTPKDAWYYDYLTDLVEKGVVNGYSDGSFGPNNKVTREEFLKMLITAIGAEITEETAEFADVKAEDWFAPYVYTAKAEGIANGVSNTEFGVGMPITRQDMCVMIYNTTSKQTALEDERFADHTEIANYAFNAVYAMKSMGVVNGYENGEFNPTGYLTRAEAVKVISLVMKMK